jgi:N-acylneuraminate cytidylyltransferase
LDTFTVIIPVRAGSRRIKNKNISPFGDDNLLTYKIKQLKEVELINTIVVSSDSDEMLRMASELGVETHKRAVEYCDDKSQPFGAVVAHICENITGDHVIWAPCTSPLTESSDYQNAIILYNEKIMAGYDSLVAVEEFRHFLWDEKGPINYEVGIRQVPSQQLPVLYRITGGLHIAPREKMIEWKYVYGPKVYKFILGKRAALDIDDLYDLECAKAWLNLPVSL